MKFQLISNNLILTRLENEGKAYPLISLGLLFHIKAPTMKAKLGR